ncbi:MAG: DUF393 domain-containing protein, partial [Phycisphaerales bacterium]|nr:DUF393 domain-containing protein [Phycisphaerales bacterium]
MIGPSSPASPPPPRSATIVTAAVALLVAGGGIALWFLRGMEIIEATSRGDFFAPLDAFVAYQREQHPGDLSLEGLRRMHGAGYVAIALLATGLLAGGLGVIHRRRVGAFLHRFFLTPEGPLNLGVFRIIVFGSLLLTVDRSAGVIRAAAERGADLRVAPFGWSAFAAHVPSSAALADAALWVLGIAGVTGLMGFMSRTSALIACLVGTYALGLPNLFGKVDHGSHHLIWFLALLAASRCGDGMSVDAIIRGVRRAGRGDQPAVTPSPAYALPIRFAWLLLGVLYLFPGLWKLLAAGPMWVAGDAVKYHLHRKWILLDWIPAVRIDRMPLVYRAIGAGTILFEISFIGLILFRRTRPLAFIAAELFHFSIRVFMRIRFVALQWCLLVLIDWSRLFAAVGRGLFRVPLAVVYDDGCGFCRRVVAALRTLDWLDRVEWVPARDRTAVERAGLGALPPAALARDIHVARGEEVRPGYAGYQLIARRLPLLWPIVPLLHVWPVTAIGARGYRKVADTRTTCGPDQLRNARPEQRRLWPVTTVGIVLLAGNTLLGLAGITSSWPLSAYPTFAGPVGPDQIVERMVLV